MTLQIRDESYDHSTKRTCLDTADWNEASSKSSVDMVDRSARTSLPGDNNYSIPTPTNPSLNLQLAYCSSAANERTRQNCLAGEIIRPLALDGYQSYAKRLGERVCSALV